MHRLPIAGASGEESWLAVRFDEPPSAASTCVLYMHGFASSQNGEKVGFFRRRFLERGLAFCSFDFQGHGESGSDMEKLTLSRNLADIGRVHGFLRDKGYQRVLLFGSSMGGGSALWYAASRPDGIVGTVSIAPALEMERMLLDAVGPDIAERWQREGRFELAHMLGSSVIGWGLIEDLRSYRGERLRELYAVPGLIFQGKLDVSVDWRNVMEFAAGCAYEGIEVHFMADGDHRLADRLEHLWSLTAGFLEARALV